MGNLSCLKLGIKTRTAAQLFQDVRCRFQVSGVPEGTVQKGYFLFAIATNNPGKIPSKKRIKGFHPQKVRCPRCEKTFGAADANHSKIKHNQKTG
jgi:hypothetical protein